MSLRYRIAGARKCDDDLVIDYLNSKLGRGRIGFTSPSARMSTASGGKAGMTDVGQNKTNHLPRLHRFAARYRRISHQDDVDDQTSIGIFVWGLYNSSAAPAEALGCMEPLSEWQGRQRFISKEIE